MLAVGWWNMAIDRGRVCHIGRRSHIGRAIRVVHVMLPPLRRRRGNGRLPMGQCGQMVIHLDQQAASMGAMREIY